MSKAVLISIQPKWCELIANGEKTVEVRKNRPKLEVPFKCYIYCTKAKNKSDKFYKSKLVGGAFKYHRQDGKVIGEFVCDRFFPYCQAKPVENAADVERQSCLTRKEVWGYAPSGNPVGWHISDLVIYDEPKELSEFHSICNEYMKDDPRCGGCDCYRSMGEYPPECNCDGMKALYRPPQSWCYVEEQTDGGKEDVQDAYP